MSKFMINIIISLVLIAVICIGVFLYFHPTHYAYNDRFILGNTQENIVARYGQFYTVFRNADGEVACGCYMIHDDTPEWIMGYDNSLWYEIRFENGVAVEVRLREGWIGG